MLADSQKELAAVPHLQWAGGHGGSIIAQEQDTQQMLRQRKCLYPPPLSCPLPRGPQPFPGGHELSHSLVTASGYLQWVSIMAKLEA